MRATFAIAGYLLLASGCASLREAPSLCVLGACAGLSEVQRSHLQKHPWESGRGHCRLQMNGTYVDPDFEEVSDEWKPVAIAMLAGDEVLELTSEKARELTGRDFPGDGVVVLSRGLKGKRLAVRSGPDGCLLVRSMNGSCFELSPRPPSPAPFVVRLDKVPAELEISVYQDCL